MGTPNLQAAQLHAEYAFEHGLDLANPARSPIETTCALYRERVAREFLAADSQPYDQLVNAAYAAFEAELYAQFKFLCEGGVRFNFTWDDPVDPETGLPSFKYTKARYEETGVLDVFRTRPGEHPLLAPIQPGEVYLYGTPSGDVYSLNGNDLFRAVHDYLGHLASGGSFGERGEKLAYLSHYKLFGPLARRALFTETVAQNAVYNVTGAFAPQKVMLFPVSYHAVPL